MELIYQIKFTIYYFESRKFYLNYYISILFIKCANDYCQQCHSCPKALYLPCSCSHSFHVIWRHLIGWPVILELLFRCHHSWHCLRYHYYTSIFGHHLIQVHLVRSCSVEEVESRQFWLSSCPSGSSLTHSGCLNLDSPTWSSTGPFLHRFHLHLQSSLHCC